MTFLFEQRRRLDTNVVQISLGSLGDEVALATGDPVFCEGCGAVFNHISRIVPAEKEDADVAASDGEGTWKCEFCFTNNAIMLDEEEIPRDESVDYILEPPSAEDVKRQDSSGSDGLVVFCMDTSGSMCVSTPVEGTIKLKYV